MKRILIKYLKKSEQYDLLELDKFIIEKKNLKHDLLLFFRRAYNRFYISQNREKHNILCAKYSKKRYQEDKDGYRAKRLTQITQNYIKTKSIKNTKNDLEFLLN